MEFSQQSTCLEYRKPSTALHTASMVIYISHSSTQEVGAGRSEVQGYIENSRTDLATGHPVSNTQS